MNALSRVRLKLKRLRPYATVRGAVFFSQRLVLKADARRGVARVVARFLPAAANQPLSQAAIDLDRQGYAVFDGIVTPAMAEDMRRHLSKSKLYAPYVDLDKAPRVSIDDPVLPDSHVLTVVERETMACPHLLDIANHPKILAAVEGAFGCKPTIGFILAWWSVPTQDGVPREAENFHRDFDDVSFLKLFIYLTNVESDSGPHEYIRASHSAPQLRGTRRYTDDEVMTAYGPDRVVRFTGPAGTMFLENTTGLHRGLHANTGKRLILQIVFSMLPMAFGPPKPYRREDFAPPTRTIDPYVNRVYVGDA